jgi:hypothetical protein
MVLRRRRTTIRMSRMSTMSRMRAAAMRKLRISSNNVY